ncbi:MAG: GNAT family N-acetyltransferase [Chloroflexota bacterium]
MEIKIQSVDQLNKAQKQALSALSRAVYPPVTTDDAVRPQIQWAATQWSLLIWDDTANLVSHVGMLTRKGKYNGKWVLLGGIGGVKTHPQARGRGYAGAGMVRASEFLRDEHHVDFSALFCRDDLLRYYQHFGWQHFHGDVFVTQPTDRMKFTFNEAMVLSGSQAAPLDGLLDLCGMPW